MSTASTDKTAASSRELIIIDTDPGVDDTMALLYALSPAARETFEVVALTIVHGNLPEVDTLARNACAVLELAHAYSAPDSAAAGRKTIPVYIGASKPLTRPAHGGAAFVHGENALGGVEIPEPRQSAVPIGERSAAEAIVQLCRERPGEITIVALGPLTNLAAALILEPQLPKLVRRVSIMGGALMVPGNISPVAEANVYNDPEAAHAVLNAGWEVLLAPLDCCVQLTLDGPFIERLRDLNPVGHFVHAIAQFYLKFFKDCMNRSDMIVHDSCALLALSNLALFTRTKRVHVDVECNGTFTRGVTIADLRDSLENADLERSKNVLALLDVDAEKAQADIWRHFEAYSTSKHA